jgi:hypothetical protein
MLEGGGRQLIVLAGKSLYGVGIAGLDLLREVVIDGGRIRLGGWGTGCGRASNKLLLFNIDRAIQHV